MNIDWDKVLEIVMLIMEQCQDDETKLQQRLRRMGLLERFQLRKALLKGGIQREQLTEAVRGCCDACAAASDAELLDFVSCCKGKK